MKKLPIGRDDFKQVIKENCYYIDKTKFIEDILNDGSIVQLFIRPRRFGKTLNISTLKYFLDIENKEENKELFKGLYIENSPLMSEQGKYPVIFISMKEVQGENFTELKNKLINKLSNIYNEYEYIREELNASNLKTFDSIWLREKECDLTGGLFNLSSYLNDYYNQQVVVLIDEYDAPLLSAYEGEYYDEAVRFFKLFYGSVLKTNVNLKFGVMTGAIRVAQAGIFSDLNNLSVNTILNKSFDEYFGLLEIEVEQALKDYEMKYKMKEVKSWYDGYRFGNAEVYNPWSILNYIKEKELKSYWINTSGNLLIKELLMKSDSSVFDILQELINGKDQMVFLNESIALERNLEPNSLWELLLFSGYLTIQDKINDSAYTVKIPNNEVRSFFKLLFVDVLFTSKYRNIGGLLQVLRIKNIKNILISFQDVLLNVASYYDLSKQNENAYHMLFTGFLYGISDLYVVHSNIETGYGRADLILKSRNKSYPSYIFEFKRSDETHLQEDAKKAYEQIEDRKYETILTREEIKDIVKIGLAFDGKKVEGYYEGC